MARFLLLSECGDGLGLAIRLIAEGHSVKFWLRDKQDVGLGKGLVDEAKSYERSVIADCTGFGTFMDAFRAEGFRAFAGSSFADALEEDRSLSEEIMSRAGIETPDSIRVSSAEEAKDFIDSVGSEKLVIKPEGSLSGVRPSETALDKEDAIKIIESLERDYSGGQVEIELQEFLSGIAVSTEGWFNGHDWIPGLFNHTLERKQMLAGDLGASTGCTGNLVWACGLDDIVKNTLIPLTDVLREHLYVGPIDINCIVNESGIFGLEFTPRFGYDAFPTALYALCEFDFGFFVESCCAGNIPDVSLKEGFGAGVRLTIPEKQKDSVELRGLSLEDLEMFYPYYLAMEGMSIHTVGDSGLLGVLNGFCYSVSGAFSVVYDNVQKLKVKKLQYRNDLLDVFLKEYKDLEALLGATDGGWIGFDLDGTLAKYSTWSEEIGEPIPKIVARAKQHIKDGDEVRIVSARGSYGQENRYAQLRKIHDWALKHLGQDVEVTDRKDPKMILLYDDRVVRVDEGKIYDDIPVRN